ncbi:VRR-NUC domain containing protein [Xanthomonas phage Pfeifenkraut]|uniref:VRR-NUC domain containing protein n=1 Tax=Xanthomonas phage Pfeifenkraut TaxID=2939132 RepID=A0A9E7J575_9CAUD|nr:VRR-NUC domain containing protein [Xanthomonas phage Pfeifenkraut]URA06941.1 VRR-NUC domain containing protein [Xanthomonas phage Pfeifenkraut]
MTPDQLAKSGTESGHQRAVFAWAALNMSRYPELKWLHHIPNGGARGDDAKTRAIRGNALKAEGVKVGVADLFLPVKRGEFSGLYIEMKKPGKIKNTSKEQDEFGEFVKAQGFGWIVCDNWESAVKVLQEYLQWQ